MKYKCREFSRSYSIQKAKERQLRRLSLEKRIAELESLISSSSSQELIDEHNKCKSDLETLYDYISARKILRSSQTGVNTVQNLQNTFETLKNIKKQNRMCTNY